MTTTQWRNLVLSILVSGFFLFLAIRGVELRELTDALAHCDPLWFALAVLVSLALMVFRAWRWQLELRPLTHVSLGRLWVVTSVAYMAINLLPVRLGEVVRPWLLSRREDVTFSNVVGNLVVEKTMDSLVILFYILAGLIITPDLPEWVRKGAIFPAVGAGILVTLVVLMWWRGEAFVARLVRWLPDKIGAAIQRGARAILDGMQVLPNARLVLAVFVVSLVLWFLPILSSYIMIRAFDIDAPFHAAIVVFIFIGFGTALPNAPGMIGTYQYACILALGVFGVEKAPALAYGIVLNAIQLITLVVQGLVALPLAGVRLADIKRATHQGTDPNPDPDPNQSGS